MEIFLDAFNYDLIEKYSSFICGITTNPLIIAKADINVDQFFEELKRITNAFPKLLINLQVVGNTAEGMIEEAKFIASLGENFIVKIPLNFEGLKALKEIAKMGVRTNGTLCFSLFQAKLAEEYGVTYISPFLGRMEDAQDDIMNFIHNLRSVITKSRILAASLRNTRHVEIAVQANCDALTVNEVVLEKMFNMPLLKDGERMFEEANRFRFEKRS